MANRGRQRSGASKKSESKRQEQLEKNRISARVYRQRRRLKQVELEQKVKELETENEALRVKVDFLERAYGGHEVPRNGAHDTPQFAPSTATRGLRPQGHGDTLTPLAEQLDTEAVAGLKKQMLEATKKLELRQAAHQREFARAGTESRRGRSRDGAMGEAEPAEPPPRGPTTRGRRFGARDFKTDAFSMLERVQVGEDNTLLDALQKVEEALMPRPSARLILYIAEEIVSLRQRRRKQRKQREQQQKAGAEPGGGSAPPAAAASNATCAAVPMVGSHDAGPAAAQGAAGTGGVETLHLAEEDFAAPREDANYVAAATERAKERCPGGLDQLSAVAAAMAATDKAVREERGRSTRKRPRAVESAAWTADAGGGTTPAGTPPGAGSASQGGSAAGTHRINALSLVLAAGKPEPASAAPSGEDSKPPVAASAGTGAVTTPPSAAAAAVALARIDAPEASESEPAPKRATRSAGSPRAGQVHVPSGGGGAPSAAESGEALVNPSDVRRLWFSPPPPASAVRERRRWLETSEEASVSAMLSDRLQLSVDQQRLILAKSDGLRRLEQVYLRAITALRKARREIEGAVELQHRVRDELINMLNPAQLTEIMAWFEENKAFMKLLRSRWHSKVSTAAGEEEGGDGVWWPREEAAAAKTGAGSAEAGGGLAAPEHKASAPTSSTASSLPSLVP